MSTVKVQLRLDDDGSKHFRVGVMSNLKPKLMSYLEVPVDTPKLELAIQLAAGAVAEDQNEKYKDCHRPEDCAKAALEAYHEVRRALDAPSTHAQAAHIGTLAIAHD